MYSENCLDKAVTTYHWMWFSQRRAGKRPSCRVSAPPLAACPKPPERPWSQCHSCWARRSWIRARRGPGAGLSTGSQCECIDRPWVCKTGRAKCWPNTSQSTLSLCASSCVSLLSCWTAGSACVGWLVLAMRCHTYDDPTKRGRWWR